MDGVEARTGWVLLTTCIQPMTGQCHYSVTRTTDGGASWSRPVRVGPGFDPANGDAIRHVHMLTAQDGFVYGAAEAYVTHDGGRTWGSTGLKPAFFAMFSGRASRAWAITYPCAKGFVCSEEVRSSLDSGRTWSTPYATPSGFYASDAISFPNGLFMTSQGDMELTLDGGTTWSFIKSQCATDNFIANVATSDGNELWELCTAYPNVRVAKMNLFVSEDGGNSWVRRNEMLVSGQQAASGYLVVLVSSRPGSAVIATNLSTNGITHDAGRTWSNLVGPTGVGLEAIRFANGFDGWALDVNQNIWFTHDGGDSWKELAGLSIPPAS